MKITINVFPSKRAIEVLKSIKINEYNRIIRYEILDKDFSEIIDYVERGAGQYYLNEKGLAIRNKKLKL